MRDIQDRVVEDSGLPGRKLVQREFEILDIWANRRSRRIGYTLGVNLLTRKDTESLADWYIRFMGVYREVVIDRSNKRVVPNP